MARRIYAGADFFAMPSRFEPCGQGQMIALRYGTPPIVHRTGGLADTVVDETTHPGEGTGFVFDDATPEGLVSACERAFALRAAGGAAWEGLLDRGMAVDFDWVTRVGSPVSRGVSAGGRDPARVAPVSRLAPRGPRSSAATVSTGCVRCGECGPPAIVAMWPSPIRAAKRGQPGVGQVAAGRRVAADDPDRHAVRGRIGQVGQAAVPVAVVEDDRSDGGLVHLGQRLGLGDDVLVGPAADSRRASPRSPRRGRRSARSTGSLAFGEMRASGNAGGSSRTSRSRPEAGDRERGGRHRAPAVADHLEVVAHQPGRPRERDQVAAVSRNRVWPTQWPVWPWPGRSGATTRRPVAARAGPTRHQFAGAARSRRG